MIKILIKLANDLDQKGLFDEADRVDSMIEEALKKDDFDAQYSLFLDLFGNYKDPEMEGGLIDNKTIIDFGKSILNNFKDPKLDSEKEYIKEAIKILKDYSSDAKASIRASKYISKGYDIVEHGGKEYAYKYFDTKNEYPIGGASCYKFIDLKTGKSLRKSCNDMVEPGYGDLYIELTNKVSK